MTNQTGEATKNTTVMTRLVQAAVLTLLLQLISQFYPSTLTRTSSLQIQEINETLLAWERTPDREAR